MFNMAFLIGRLGADPEVRYTPGGAMVTSFRIATSRFWKAEGGERKERTEWHKIITFQGLAEFSAQSLAKGKLVAVVGEIQYRSWEDPTSGDRKYVTEIRADRVQLLERKPEAAASGEPEGAFSGFPGVGDEDVPF